MGKVHAHFNFISKSDPNRTGHTSGGPDHHAVYTHIGTWQPFGPARKVGVVSIFKMADLD